MANTSFHTAAGVSVTAVTADQMRAVDRIAVEEVELAVLQMMEHAGRTLAWHASEFADGSAIVIAGNGGNGGGGMVCARHLANHGVSVDIVLDRPPERLTNPAAHQYRILDAMNTPITVGPERLDVVEESTIVIDALIGYGLDGDVQDPARTLIQSVANEDMTIVSLDVPSGIDATTGETLGSALAPDRVITLALPKTGLVGLDVPLYLADIGIPRVVYDRLGIQYENPFSRDGWVELHGNHS